MDKESFNRLKIDSQVEFINNELAKGKSLTNITSEIGVGRTTLRDRFTKNNYIFNSQFNRYVMNYEVSSTEDVDLYDEIKVENKDNLIKIDKDLCSGEVVGKTFKTYKTVLEAFTKFCDSKSNLNKDLIAMALIEYMKKYK